MALKVENLTKYYGDKLVVDKLSLEMASPGVHALLGGNGAGKTTSIRMILGLIERNGGTVTWNGSELDTKKVNIGYLAEERGLYQNYSIYNQLVYFANLKGMSTADANEKIKQWSDRLKLNEYIFPKDSKGRDVASKKPMQLSKGNQQKIQIMSVLISDPELIILDEPLSGLDPVNTDMLKEVILDEIKKKKYLIMSSHQMSVIEEFCSNITMLKRSKTVLQGNLDDIKKSYGRKNIILDCDIDVNSVFQHPEVKIIDKRDNLYTIKVENEQYGYELLNTLVNKGAKIGRFIFSEPTLHEIFIEKVGE